MASPRSPIFSMSVIFDFIKMVYRKNDRANIILLLIKNTVLTLETLEHTKSTRVKLVFIAPSPLERAGERPKH